MSYLWVKCSSLDAVEVDAHNCRNVGEFKERIKLKLSPLLDAVATAQISLSVTEEKASLRNGLSLAEISTQPGYCENDDGHPLIVKIQGASPFSGETIVLYKQT